MMKEGFAMNTWRSVALLLVLLTVPSVAHAALTLEDLTVPGAQFAAGPLVFRDFNIVFFTNPSCCALPTSLTDISVVTLDAGGFTLGSTWDTSGKFASAQLFMTFTAATVSAPIGDLILSVEQVVVAGNTGASLNASAGMSPGPGTSLFASANPLDPFVFNPPTVIGSLSSHVQISPTATSSRFEMDVLTYGGACSGFAYPCDDGFVTFTDPTLRFALEAPEPSVFWLFGLISGALPLVWRRIAGRNRL